jgi:hypothetical protein
MKCRTVAKIFGIITIAVVIPACTLYAQRVMVAVQEPVGYLGPGEEILYPAFALQILDANANENMQEYVTGWGGAMPAKIESLPSEGVGAVYSEDGSLSIVNYNSGSVTSQPTMAATEFICNDEYLIDGLKTLNAGWSNRDVEFVLKTTVVDAVAGPPVVVAANVW